MPPKRRVCANVSAESDSSSMDEEMDDTQRKKVKMDVNSDDYSKRRERNNVAVKKSREKSRKKSEETIQRVTKLRNENDVLEQKIRTLSKELDVLKNLFLAHAGSVAESANNVIASATQTVIKKINVLDPELYKPINIGFPLVIHNKASRQMRKKWMEERKERELSARHRKLELDVEDVRNQWADEERQRHIKSIADHYGIYKDLFCGAFFYPSVDLDIFYDFDEEEVTPVHRGNKIFPSEASTVPNVFFKAEPDSLWTLTLSAPDSHLQDNEKEYLHWSVGNIRSNDISSGEVMCDYFPPFPAKGTGYHRYVFILYKQEKLIDYSHHKIESNSLEDRTFSTIEFYRNLQSDMTPAGLAFFQSEWDTSVTDLFRNKLDMPEPVFEFMHPPPYHPKQVRYPHKQPFNLYLDRYRDTKDIQEEVLREKLKTRSPFEPPPESLKYPNAIKIPDSVPSWLKIRIQNMRLRRFQWKDLD